MEHKNAAQLKEALKKQELHKEASFPRFNKKEIQQQTEEQVFGSEWS